jgi:hypothetical protein
MRLVIKNILIAAIVLPLATCNETADKIIYKGPDFVFLDSKAQVTLYENQKTPLIIPVKVNVAQTLPINVVFEVIGDNVLAGSDYKVQTGSPVQIVRGKYSANISIIPVDNNIIQTEKRTITLRIKSIDNPSLTLQVVKEVEIDLLEDDCAPNVPKVSLFVGAVNINDGQNTVVGKGEGGAGGICGGTLLVTGKFFGEKLGDSAMTVILTQNNVITTKGLASVVRFKLFSTTDQYEYEANGTYDETVKNITLNFTVYDTSDNSVAAAGTHIITPK